MIIYGSRATEVATENIRGKCSNCESENSIYMSIYQKYAHVFWIPLFPIGKTGFTQCTNCKQVLEKKEFLPELNESYIRLKSNAKAPFWTFSGLTLIAVLLVLGFYFNHQSDIKNAEYISAPFNGDIYRVKIDYNQYTLFKVDHVNEDTVYLLVSQYESNKRSGLKEIKDKGDVAYYDEIIPVLKADLKTMFDNGDIFDIDRD